MLHLLKVKTSDLLKGKNSPVFSNKSTRTFFGGGCFGLIWLFNKSKKATHQNKLLNLKQAPSYEHLSVHVMQRCKNGPIASDLEAATKVFIPAPESQGNLHYKLQWVRTLAHAFCNTSFVLHCWNRHFLDSKNKFLLNLTNVTRINSIRYQIRLVLAQIET